MNEDAERFSAETPGSGDTAARSGASRRESQRPEVCAVSDRHGARMAIRKGNRVVMVILAIMTLVSVPVAGIIRSWPGALGALAAMVIMWVVAAVGIGANRLVLRNPLRTSGYVFGAYLVKLVIVIVAVALLRPLPQVDSKVIFLVLVIAILLTTIGEARVVAKTNKITIGKV
ncbi:hypothetical protein [uncultured Varibaculum sp.]|uniref:hypothetical protein n=1 Tax=uncultured Varibaculum sp. TaxID=413896 RepID=UPI00258B67AC|nr:hypothetical protein [uncultured Varibaculum sp.]